MFGELWKKFSWQENEVLVVVIVVVFKNNHVGNGENSLQGRQTGVREFSKCGPIAVIPVNNKEVLTWKRGTLE